MQQRRGLDLAHRIAITVRWERRRGGEHLGSGEFQPVWCIIGHGHLGTVSVEIGEEVSPITEAGDIDVIRSRRQSRLGDGLTDAPIGFRGEIGGAGLDDEARLRGHHLADESVELDTVELRRRDIVGVGKIGDDRVVGRMLRLPQPREGIGGDRSHPRIVEGVVVERGEVLRGLRQFEDRGVEVDERDGLDVGILEDLTHGQAITAAEDEDVAARTVQQRMDEAFVIAVLIGRGELQIPVEEQPRITGPLRLGEHDLLVVRPLRIHDRIPVETLAGGDLDIVGVHPHHSEPAEDEHK